MNVQAQQLPGSAFALCGCAWRSWPPDLSTTTASKSVRVALLLAALQPTPPLVAAVKWCCMTASASARSRHAHRQMLTKGPFNYLPPAQRCLSWTASSSRVQEVGIKWPVCEPAHDPPVFACTAGALLVKHAVTQLGNPHSLRQRCGAGQRWGICVPAHDAPGGVLQGSAHPGRVQVRWPALLICCLWGAP